MPTIKINGRDLEYEPGETVIQVAHRNGIDVAHYCYHPSMSPEGNCRICMVEVEGWPKPVVSCKQLCGENMAVQTESELAQSARAGTMEMLLVNHPLDCPICDQAGECHLQEYSYELGHGESRSTTPKTHLPKNVPFGEEIVYDAERCIKCTLCVRFCNEITKTGELAMANRSDNEQVVMTSKGEFTTNYSMNIVDLCPVGALTSRDFRFKSRLWFMDFTPSLCTGCARGCNVTIGGRGGRFMRMEPRENQDVNQWWMCDPGRLGYGHVNSETRLATPAVRDANGQWQPATFEQAIVAASAALKDARESHDVLLDGGATLEELEAARALASAMGGQARFAAATGDDADEFLIVNEKGANAKGAEMLGLERQADAAPAAVLVVERDGNVPAALRDGAGAVVAFVTDATNVPDSVRVAFPYGSWAERSGLLVNVDGRVQELRAARQVGPGNLSPAFALMEELTGELDGNHVPRDRGELVAAVKNEKAFAEVAFPAGVAAGQTVGAGS
ncbi:MAG: 2Fe-2S iron-sulfur cluster-binding protein [Planctomycetota bacterium]|nr:2Fe-2S iron-sulfur cluster-binding protein [Planctomycetota bacterium]